MPGHIDHMFRIGCSRMLCTLSSAHMCDRSLQDQVAQLEADRQQREANVQV